MSNDERDVFEKSIAKIDVAKKKSGYLLGNFLNYILLLGVIVAEIIFTFFSIKIEELDADFYLLLLTNIICNVICFCVFIPQGKQNENKNNTNYKANCVVWSELSTEVQNNCPQKFNAYCEEQTLLKKEKKLQTYIKNAVISNEKYNELKELNDSSFFKELKRKGDNGYIYTKNQRKWLALTRKPIKVRNIDPCLILTGTASDEFNEVGYSPKISYELRAIVSRIIKIIISSILMYSIGLKILKDPTIETIAQCIIRVITIMAASVLGFYTGVSSIRIRNSMIKKNINFIKTFNNGNKNIND